jgi:signal transduction histidine kinase
VAEDRVPDSRFRADKIRGLADRFANLIRVDSASILMSFKQTLEKVRGPVSYEDRALDCIVATGSRLLSDLSEKIRAGESPHEVPGKAPACATTETRDEAQLSPVETLRAAVALFDATVGSLAQHVKEDPELLPCFVAAIITLNENLALRTNEATEAHTRNLLDRIYQVQLDERRRIARELHDRLGEGLSVALRQVELSELVSAEHQHEGTAHAGLAREALVEAMRRLRFLTSDLRQDPVTSLEKALTHYLDSFVTDAGIRLQVRGDERWATPTVIDEAYLIIREAIRNAFTHAGPSLVLVEIDVEQHQLHARVEDNGCGFVAALVRGGTAGLASMRERAVLIGGTLTVNSVPPRGTQVCLVVPLREPAQ